MTDFQISTLKEFYRTGEAWRCADADTERSGLGFCLSPRLMEIYLLVITLFVTTKFLPHGYSHSSLLAADIVSGKC